MKPSDKRMGYRGALAKACLSSRQPQEAMLHLEELLKNEATSLEDHLDLLCNLAHAQVTSTASHEEKALMSRTHSANKHC